MHRDIMRTTLTLDPEIADRLKEEAALGKRSFKTIVNEALRRGLGMETTKRTQRFRVQPHSSRLFSGIDHTRLNQLVDELDVEAFIAKQGPRS